VLKAASVGVVLAVFVLLIGTYGGGGGLDGPCLGGELGRSGPEGTRVQARQSWWPPGIRCTVTAANGSFVTERVYPARWVWVMALLVGLVPVVRRQRRRNQ